MHVQGGRLVLLGARFGPTPCARVLGGTVLSGTVVRIGLPHLRPVEIMAIWAVPKLSPSTSVAGPTLGFNAAATVYSVEFHQDIAIFVAVWQRGTSGAPGQFFGIASNPAGTASVVGMQG